MGYNVNRIKQRAEELAEGYEEARDEAFNEEFRDFLCDEEFVMNSEQITYDDIQGFLDNFTFPDEGEWSCDKAQSELDDIGDQQYEQWKDERDERENS
jgi:hypothetical protein